MIAAVCKDVDQPLVLQEVTTPQPGKGEVLIRVKAAALNHRDVWIQKGMYAGLRYPIILGSDCAGIVSSVGSSEHEHWIGKEVVVNPGFYWGDREETHSRDFQILGLPQDGSFAEYVVVPESQIHLKPVYMSWEQAAAIPLAGLTGHRALFLKGGIHKGSKVLITGIGGGVALLMLQMAVAVGAEVYVTSSNEEKIQKAIKLGARLGVNYTISGWHKLFQSAVEGFDVIVDSAAGEGFKHFVDLANPGGRIVFFGGTQGAIGSLNPQKIFWKHLSIYGTTMGSPTSFQEMLHLFEDHQIQPVIHNVYNLNNIQMAMDEMDKGKQFGKLVVRVAES